MTKKWVTKKLGEVCTIDKSQGIHRGRPYVGLEHIEPNTGRFIGSREPFNVKSATFAFSKEHLLYGRLRPYLNKVLAPQFDGHCSTELFPIKPSPNISRQFLLYWFLSDRTVERISSTCTGARMPRANVNTVMKFDFSFPDLAEQHRICAILDAAFDRVAIANANIESNMRSARMLFESRLACTFGQPGDRAPLSSLAKEITDGDHMPPPKSKVGVPFVTISDINRETREIDFSDTFMVSEDYFRKLKSNKKPRMGDVVYTVTGATLGIPVLVKDDREFCFQRHIGLIRPLPETDSAWLVYALLSPQAYAQATTGSTGTAQKTVSLAVLRNIMLPRISLDEQRKTAAMLDVISDNTQRLVSIYRRKLQALATLKNSLLHAGMTGEL